MHLNSSENEQPWSVSSDNRPGRLLFHTQYSEAIHAGALLYIPRLDVSGFVKAETPTRESNVDVNIYCQQFCTSLDVLNSASVKMRTIEISQT